MIKLAPEGYTFIGGFVALAVAAYLLVGPRLAIAALVLALFMVFFFRDPARPLPAAKGFISPADGRVVSVAPMYEREHLKDNTMRISIFMSPLDVHVNRSPCDAEVVSVEHTSGRFRAAYREVAAMKNENTAMHLKCGENNVLVRQVAGFLARRVVNRKQPGDTLKRGERFGIIKFSSRLDVYLPVDAEVRVKPSERVKAGQSILAVMPEAKP